MDTTSIISLIAISLSLAAFIAGRLVSASRKARHDPIDHFIGGDWPHVPSIYRRGD